MYLYTLGEVTAVMETFLKDNLLELRENLWNNKYNITREGPSITCGPQLAPACSEIVPFGKILCISVSPHLCTQNYFIIYSFYFFLYFVSLKVWATVKKATNFYSLMTIPSPLESLAGVFIYVCIGVCVCVCVCAMCVFSALNTECIVHIITF